MLENFYDFSLLTKIWPFSLLMAPLFIENGFGSKNKGVAWLKLLGGKTKNVLNNLGKLLFAVFEGQCFIAILVQGVGQCRTAVHHFWSFMASESGLCLAAHVTWSTNAFGLSSFCIDSLDSPFDQNFSNHLLFSIKVTFE